MNQRSRLSFLPTAFVLISSATVLVTTFGGSAPAETEDGDQASPVAAQPSADDHAADRRSANDAESKSAEPRAIADEPIAEFQRKLLDVAFRSATKMPVNPHVKTRSRMQQEIADTCFDLDQPQRALACIENIADWRRGNGYADYAFYCAKHGDTAQAKRYNERALDIAQQTAKSDTSQDWQVDRIRVAAARTHIVLGETNRADELANGAADFEVGKMEALKTERLDDSAFDGELARYSRALSDGSFDQRKNALEKYAQLFDRFYEDPKHRESAEEALKSSTAKLPLMIRIDLMLELTESAIRHGDKTKALSLLDETFVITESAPWLPEDHVAILARLAEVRGRAGDTERARHDADATLAIFDADKEKIENYRRGIALRPVAEAYAAMGDTKAALSVYKRALEEGSRNPNARSRAEDLVATCRSMARRAVEPDAALWTRIEAISAGLNDPW